MFYFLNLFIVIIIILIIIIVFLVFIFGFHLRCWVDSKNGVGAYLTSYTPVVFVMPLLAEAAVAMALGSIISVSAVMYSSSSTLGNSADNSGCIPWSGSSRPSR